MANPSKAKGDKAELEAAAILSDLLGFKVQRRHVVEHNQKLAKSPQAVPVGDLLYLFLVGRLEFVEKTIQTPYVYVLSSMLK